MTAGTAVIDVTDATFGSAVLEQSRSKPVVVDFWAAWCGPCRILGPIIEKVTAEFGGEIVLAKVNVDENPQSAMQYRAHSIPTVKAFRDGRVVDEFTGALPEPYVREFFERLAPSPADRAVAEAERLLASGKLAEAEQPLRAVLAADPNHAGAVKGLAQVLIRRGEPDEADALLKRLPADREAKVLRHRLFLERYAARHAGEDLRGAAAADPRDPRARYRWGLLLAAEGKYPEAMDELLESVRLDRGWEDGAARKSILAIFDILGLDDPLTRQYQRKLENVLF
jgi:putative thioredoxin